MDQNTVKSVNFLIPYQKQEYNVFKPELLFIPKIHHAIL